MSKAVILAAGKGTRLKPFTDSKHKSFLEINNETLIERLIKNLLLNGIEEIVVVTGYFKEQFHFLVDKYENVTLIYNDKYETYNNYYSLFLANKYISDCFIIEGDIYIDDFNFMEKEKLKSLYFVKRWETNKKEWKITSDSDQRLKNIEVSFIQEGDFISAGITYLSNNDGETLKNKILEKYQPNEKLKDYHWDDVMKENLDILEIYSEKLQDNTVFEIDDIKDYNQLLRIVNKG